MIRVTVDLISAIDQSRSKTLGVCEIVNDGTGTIHSCDYDVRLSKWAPKLSETWKKGRVIGFPRTVRGPWDLLYRALKETVGARNGMENVKMKLRITELEQENADLLTKLTEALDDAVMRKTP